jgi:glutamate-ammonia-ligase adenylyltransferase
MAMGSLGAGQMTAASDLDLIVIYDAQGVEFTEGRRPLDPRRWFAKATQALVTALSAPTAAGKLYEVDMRLRPSGRQGPVATALSSFDRYQREEAWTWEHMALTRARVVAGADDLARDIEDIRCDVIQGRDDREKVATDAADMRARLAAAGRGAATFRVKDGPGGLRDIELLAQAGALIAGVAERRAPEQLEAAAAAGWIDPDDAASLKDAHALFSIVNQCGRLLTDGDLDAEDVGAGGRAFLAEKAGAPDDETLGQWLDAARGQAVKIVDAKLPPPEETKDA